MLLGTIRELATAGGTAFKAYETGKAEAPGILMIHEWWGLTDGVKRTADELASQGFSVMAIDLYDGTVAKTRETASAAMRSLDPTLAVEKCAAVIDALASNGRKTGTIGWCMGGGISIQASLARAQKVAATCVYYGALPEDVKGVTGLSSVLGIFAEKDGWITPAMVAKFDAALTAAKIDHITKTFPADHAFANPSSANHDTKSAGEAWKLTLEFFRAKL